jgi:enamine deaminase RidA (YjgF/YER057c/UK114 family)
VTTPERRLAALGLELPERGPQTLPFVRVKRVGDTVHGAGHTSTGGARQVTGRLGDGLDLEQGREAARIALLGALASIRELLGSLDQVAEVISLRGFVNSAPDFTDQPKVMNAASELLNEIFGETGVHVRSALGVAALPGDAAVEIELTVRARAS